MRAYVRTTDKRLVTQLAVSGCAPRQTPRSENARKPGTPPFWARFTQILEDAAGAATSKQRPALLRLARCARLDLQRVFRCGEEEALVGAWCGHPWCPACAHQSSAQETRFVVDRWPERVMTISLPIGLPGGLTLPSSATVAAAREAWGRVSQRVAQATGLARLNPMPRAVISPDGITFFLELPWEAGSSNGELLTIAETALTDAVRSTAFGFGLRPEVRVGAREAAALVLRQARQQEAHRFMSFVGRDLERLDEIAWRREFPSDASLAATLRAMTRRWLQRLERRHQTLRRKLVLGSKRALPTSNRCGPDFAKRRCPSHGAGCPVEATVVRDSSHADQVVHHFDGEALSGAYSRHGIAAFLEQASPPPPSLRVILPRLRRAG